jgi:glucan phosphoethanolaminetransferase (alkaline phosphatase superfamily)
MITLLLLILAIALIVIAVRLRRRRQRRRVMIVKLMAIIVLLIAAFYIVKYQSLPSRSSNRDGKLGSEESSQNMGWVDSARAEAKFNELLARRAKQLRIDEL